MLLVTAAFFFIFWFFAIPILLGVLRFKSTAQYVLGVGICATGQPLVNQRLEIRRNGL